MEDNKQPSNVIQFPAKRKEATEPEQVRPSTPPPLPKTPQSKPAPKSKKGQAILGGAVLAVLFATGAVNRFTFDSARQAQTLDASSLNGSGRAIASVERMSWKRDARWEKQIAEQLASSQSRGLASTGIGHAPSLEDKLRRGTLEEKYTIYKPDAKAIKSILLQDSAAQPAYILDRPQFLEQYGSLLDDAFGSAKLKSVEVSEDKTVELYMLFDKEKHLRGEAQFELDRHKRLLSLKVEPVKI